MYLLGYANITGTFRSIILKMLWEHSIDITETQYWTQFWEHTNNIITTSWLKALFEEHFLLNIQLAGTVSVLMNSTESWICLIAVRNTLQMMCFIINDVNSRSVMFICARWVMLTSLPGRREEDLCLTDGDVLEMDVRRGFLHHSYLLACSLCCL